MKIHSQRGTLRASLVGLLAFTLFACSGHHGVDGAPETQGEGTGTPESAGSPADVDAGAQAGSDDADGPASPAKLTGAAAVDALRAHVTEFMAKPEHDAEKVRVQHLLVAFVGAERSRATRSKAEAEQLTADLWAEIQAGDADFDELIRQYTNDSPPGIYLMTATAPTGGGSYRRGDMAPAFGNAGWRLEVGEYGVAGYERRTSPFGWHIVKRIE